MMLHLILDSDKKSPMPAANAVALPGGENTGQARYAREETDTNSTEGVSKSQPYSWLIF
ncbi:MAG: hypothetical protein M0R28_03455 [Pigmentiphaga sp.]|nr:hypothetical protein [Pigmentiphaga sp.]